MGKYLLDDDVRWRVRATVDRRIAEVLDKMPCFCTPERPELEAFRKDYCAKHWVLKRLDVDELVEEQLPMVMDIETVAEL